MPNECLYEMRIKGTKEDINRIIGCLKQEYHYPGKKPTGKHFFRIFDAFIDEPEPIPVRGTKDVFIQQVWGYCAWSVDCCMLGSDERHDSYYAECKKEYPEKFMGTNLQEQSKGCIIEVFSEEIGCEFSEHYIFMDGKELIEDDADAKSVNVDADGKAIIDKELEWEEEICVLNMHKTGSEEGYVNGDWKWKIKI